MLSVSRILTLLAGALVGAVVIRRKPDQPAGTGPWRPELEQMRKQLTLQLESRDARVADLRARVETLAAGAACDPRVDELQRRIEMVGGLAPRIESFSLHFTELQRRIEAQLAASGSDARVDALIGRVEAFAAQVEALRLKLEGGPTAPWEEPLAGIARQVAGLQEQMGEHERKLSATSQVVAAMEQAMAARMMALDQRLAAQDRTLEAVQAGIAQSDELIERVLDLVQALPPVELREPVVIAAEAGEPRELQM